MGTYVQISREELEDWLKTLPIKGSWRTKPGTAGVYLLPLSDNVAIKLSSTIGSKDDAMGRGRASMQLALVSLITGRVLNKKAQGQTHFKRTSNWKQTWRKGFDRLRNTYLKAQSFYEALATIEDRDKYQKDIIRLIESIPDWGNHHILADFHAKLSQGGILTLKQRALLDKIVAEKSRHQPEPDKEILDKLEKLHQMAKRVGDDWLADFCESVRNQIKKGRPLSPKQLAVIEKNLKRYRLGRFEQRMAIRAVMRRELCRELR